MKRLLDAVQLVVVFPPFSNILLKRLLDAGLVDEGREEKLNEALIEP
jgi:hypothetical protein